MLRKVLSGGNFRLELSQRGFWIFNLKLTFKLKIVRKLVKLFKPKSKYWLIKPIYILETKMSQLSREFL
ncbi:hypothetical protein FDUTEX481_08254 [Tolypothrix sp. PCC 7601]|nr:hypothetical protein FDUTEX481_08254 [Tolypothrix sp. PCC 7601]